MFLTARSGDVRMHLIVCFSAPAANADEIQSINLVSPLCFSHAGDVWISTPVTFEPSIVSMETDYHQASLSPLVCPQDGEAMSSQIPGPVTFQPGVPGMRSSAAGSDSFPCLRPLTFPQKTSEEAHCSDEVTVMVKEKRENGILLIQYYLFLCWEG